MAAILFNPSSFSVAEYCWGAIVTNSELCYCSCLFLSLLFCEGPHVLQMPLGSQASWPPNYIVILMCEHHSGGLWKFQPSKHLTCECCCFSESCNTNVLGSQQQLHFQDCLSQPSSEAALFVLKVVIFQHSYAYFIASWIDLTWFYTENWKDSLQSFGPVDGLNPIFVVWRGWFLFYISLCSSLASTTTKWRSNFSIWVQWLYSNSFEYNLCVAFQTPGTPESEGNHFRPGQSGKYLVPWMLLTSGSSYL